MDLFCVTSQMWQGKEDGREMKTKEDLVNVNIRMYVCVYVCTQVRGRVAGVALSSHRVGPGG